MFNTVWDPKGGSKRGFQSGFNREIKRGKRRSKKENDVRKQEKGILKQEKYIPKQEIIPWYKVGHVGLGNTTY